MLSEEASIAEELILCLKVVLVEFSCQLDVR